MNYDGIFTPDDAAIFGGAYDESLASLPEPASLGLLADEHSRISAAAIAAEPCLSNECTPAAASPRAAP